MNKHDLPEITPGDHATFVAHRARCGRVRRGVANIAAATPISSAISWPVARTGSSASSRTSLLTLKAVRAAIPFGLRSLPAVSRISC